MKTGALIVAAGMEKDTCFKPMKQYGSITMLERLILILEKAGAAPIVVITGNQAHKVVKCIKNLGVICLRNSKYAEQQMMDSVKIGFQYLEKRCDQILVCPADMGLFTYKTAQILMSSGAKVAVPVHNDQEGHPVLVSTQIIRHLIHFQKDGGLRRALRCCGVEIKKIPVDDKGILIEADQFDENIEDIALHNDQLLRPVFTLSLSKEKDFFSQKTASLLQLIKQTESVRTACNMLGISYSNCWNMLNTVEEQFGTQILVRHPGGMNGGHTCLSKEGELLLERFEQFYNETNQAMKEIYLKIFSANEIQ